MAYFGITATEAGPVAAGGGGIEAGLRHGLGRAREAAPIVVLVHGYKFDAARGDADPHRSLYAFRPLAESGRIRSWPAGLGFSDDGGESGLCIGYAWPSRPPPLRESLIGRCSGFRSVYERAGRYGARLAEVLTLLQRLAPERPVDVLAHSLGARVALAALPHLTEPPGRLVLLGAAEFGERARAFLAGAPRTPEVYNIVQRSNDIYDTLFALFAPRSGRGDRPVGQGLGSPHPGWLDLELDRPDLTQWINAQGIPLAPSPRGPCHWSFYTRAGALAVYEAILRRRPGWDIPSLRALPFLAADTPRPAPRLTSQLPVPNTCPSDFDFGNGLSRA